MTRAILARIFGVSFWALLNALSLRLLNLISMYLAARYLVAEAYGSLALITNTVQTWSILLAGGVSITLSKYAGEYRGKSLPCAASLISSLSILVAGMAALVFALTSFCGDFISRLFFNGKLSAHDVAVLGGWLFLLTMQTTVQGAISGLEQYKKTALFSLLGGSVALLLIYAIVPHQRDWILAALIIGTTLTWLTTSGAVITTIRSWKCGWRYFDTAHMSLIIKFGIPAFVSGLVVSQSQWYANLKVANAANGLADLAGLNISLQWYAIILFIPGAVSNAMLPIMARLGTNQREQLSYLHLAFLTNLTIALLMAATAIAWRGQILGEYGEHYRGFAELFKYLAIAASINGATSIFTQHIASHGKGLLLLYINIFWALLFLCINFVLNFEQRHAEVVGISYMFSNAAQAILVIFFSYRLTLQHKSKTHDSFQTLEIPEE